MPSIEEAASAVGGNAEQARELSAGITGAKETITELAGALAAVGVEARASEANGCADEAEALAGQANALADALDRLRSRVDALRGLLTTLTRGSAPPTPQAGDPPAYNPLARDPKRSEEIRRFGWPRNTTGRTSARGLLYDASGNPVLHKPLKALKGNRVYDTPDLKDEWRARDVATSWHIEGGVAAYMRATKTKSMALWLNLPPCGGRGDYDDADPKGCHANLPKILPKGYTLVVHMEYEDGRYRRRTFPGTGEALKDE
jgi:hypothetical protein